MTDALPIIAGHQLRYVDCRWGRLIHVGSTDMAFRTIEQAEQHARDNALTYATLCSEYQTFNLKHGLKLGSADEHLFDENLTDAQRLWLVDFSRRWESVADHEREQR